jgi:hypothetical protein
LAPLAFRGNPVVVGALFLDLLTFKQAALRDNARIIASAIFLLIYFVIFMAVLCAQIFQSDQIRFGMWFTAFILLL